MNFTRIFFYLLVFTGFCQVYGQQAIINLPSADITPKGKNFLMHETQTNFWNDIKSWYATNFYCRGIGYHTEIALTAYHSGFPGTSTNENIGFGFKTSLPILKEWNDFRDVNLTIGSMGLINTRGLGIGNFSYSHLNFRLPFLRTRITAGGSFGTHQLFLPNQGEIIDDFYTVHGIFGLEQPLFTDKIQWINEWFTGIHDFGYFTTGLLFHPFSKNHVIVVAYKIPNDDSVGKDGIVLEYGLFF